MLSLMRLTYTFNVGTVKLSNILSYNCILICIFPREFIQRYLLHNDGKCINNIKFVWELLLLGANNKHFLS